MSKEDRTYTYAISQTKYDKWDKTRLTQEISKSPRITQKLESIQQVGLNIEITFYYALIASEQAYLTYLVTTHTGEPVPADTVQLETTQSDNVPVFAQAPRIGSERVIATHNFCDKCSWFGESDRITSDTLVDSGDGLTFTGTHTFWIDVYHGRWLNASYYASQVEHGYKVEVKINGVVATRCPDYSITGGDYWIDFESGSVVFTSSQSGKTVTASYSYAKGSIFVLEPKAGTVLIVEDAETDISCGRPEAATDAAQHVGRGVMKDDIMYSVYGYAMVFVPQDPSTSTFSNLRVLASGNVSLTGEQTVDGVSLVSGDRVGCFSQTQGTEDGIWIVQEDAWVRSDDCPVGLGVAGYVFFVEEGTSAGAGFTFMNASGSDVVGTDDLVTFGCFSPGEKISLQEDKYQNMNQISVEARGAKPVLKAAGAELSELAMEIPEFRRRSRGTYCDIQPLPFAYITSRDLHSAYGMDLRVYLKNNSVFGGYTSTLTFYCTEKAE